MRLAMNAAFSERAPLPAKAPEPQPGESLPRYWRHPELADRACIGSNGVISGEPKVIAHPGGDSIRSISGERRPTPREPVVETISSCRRRDVRSAGFYFLRLEVARERSGPAREAVASPQPARSRSSAS